MAMSDPVEPGPLGHAVGPVGTDQFWKADHPDPDDGLRVEPRVQSAEDWPTLYQRAKREADEAYVHVGPLWRLKLSDPETLVSQVVCLAMFGVWWFLLPRLHFGDVALISQAFAAPAGTIGFDPKPWIHMAIFVALFATFVVSIWVNYFSKSEKAADQAGTVSKTLLGFFIGAATNYLGITTA
jgi:hypothetical protein